MDFAAKEADLGAFTGRIAIVTGAASGIGQAVSQELGRRGAFVIAVDINGQGAEQTASAIVEKGGRAKSVAVDVTKPEQIQSLVDMAVSDYGGLDYMFNNAGIAILGEVRDFTLDHWKKIIDVNLWGVIYGTSAAYKVMAARGSGHIVNTASLAGLIPAPTLTAYSVTKHAVVGLSTSLRAEGAALGVRVSAVCPGLVQTGITEAGVILNAERELVLQQVPFKPIDPSQAARSILRGVERNRDIIIFPAHARTSWWLYRFSRGLVQAAARGAIRDFRKIRTDRP
jgi:NAD(P)-dependent dehydrogenase (short-subunit alcohol dehydrogenase family)